MGCSRKLTIFGISYDTIVDTSSISKAPEAHAAYSLDNTFDRIIEASRTYLLEYTWRLTIMGRPNTVSY